MRDMRTGHYTPYDELVRVGQAAGIPVVKCVDVLLHGQSSTAAQDVIDKLKSLTCAEGYVLRFEATERWYKIKTNWYD